MLKVFKYLIYGLIVGFISACSTTSDPSAVKNLDVTQSSGVYDPINDSSTIVYKKRSIYFDFDSYKINPEYLELLSVHAKYLGENKSKAMNIVIQGNTDERGTTEYNLALGQKRAESVKKALTILGVDDSQIEAVSFGKEKPKLKESNEAAWRENRRADIVYR